MLIVKKFGGTSVADKERIFNVAKRCIRDYQNGNDVVVVLSAMGKYTDELIAKAKEINPNPSKREMDMLFTIGEQMSVSLMAMAMDALGVRAISLNAFQVTMHTTSSHQNARLKRIDTERIRRELDAHSFGVFTTGRFQAGAASNVIPDSAEMWGTIRTTDPEGAVTELLHKRMTEIVQGVATAYRCTAEITFSDYCPCMVVDKELAGNALTYMGELLGKGAMDMTPMTGGKPGGGSEDFAFVSHEVPTVSMFLTAGNANEGYTYGQHHPKVKFDDSVLFEGSAAYAYMALRWLQEHK